MLRTLLSVAARPATLCRVSDIAAEPQITRHVLRLFALMTSDPLAWWWGMKLSDELDLRSGTIYPLLARLEKAEWLESSWEEIDPREEGRPRRRLYRLTGEGERIAASELSQLGAARTAPARPGRGGARIGQPGMQWS